MESSPRRGDRSRRVGGLVIAALLSLVALAGCAAMRRQEAQDHGNLLTAAGFRIKPADTPQRMARLDAMPPLKMVARPKDDKMLYTYADPYACNCVYVGGEQEYAEYRRLAVQKQIADEQLAASMAAEDAAMDWQMWGPFWW